MILWCYFGAKNKYNIEILYFVNIIIKMYESIKMCYTSIAIKCISNWTVISMINLLTRHTENVIIKMLHFVLR